MAPSEKTTSYERGTYYFFDVNSWRKVMVVSLIHPCMIPSIAGAQRIPLGLRQTWGTTISAIISASRAITRSCRRWRSASQPSWATEWKSGAHGGAGAGRSWRLASCGATQLRTIVKGRCEGGELRTILTIPLDRWLVVIQPIIDLRLSLGWTMMISKYKPNKEPPSSAKLSGAFEKTALQPNIETPRLRQKFFEGGSWATKWNLLFMFLPLRRYHCVGILCFMPNPSQNSHNLPAVIMRSNGPTILGKICMEPKSVGSDKLSGPIPLAAAFLGLQPPVQRVCYYPVRIEIQYWHQAPENMIC